MKGSIQDLYGLVSDSLYEMTWRCNLPIHSAIGVWAFLDAFRDCGVEAQLDDNRATFSYFGEVAGTPYGLSASMTQEEIATGWGWNPTATPAAFYDSICEIYDRMGSFSNRDEKEGWFTIRESESRRVRDAFEEQLKPFFQRYHEHMLVPVSGELPTLDSPQLFNQILNPFPLDVYEHAVFLSDRGALRDGPCATALLCLDFDELDAQEYYPRPSAMMDYFWGHYLNELSLQKGYRDKNEKLLSSFVENGWHAIRNGSHLSQSRVINRASDSHCCVLTEF